MSNRIAARRLGAQRLVGRPFADPVEVVRSLGAVQAQDYAGAKWALAQRTTGSTEADIDALFDAGAILRTHVLRPTWHFVDPADIRWLLALTAPRVHAACAYQYRVLGLDDAAFARSDEVIAAALAGGVHLTRAELGRVLTAAGIAADGLRLGYLVSHAELEGVICSGARRGRQHTYALLDERVPPSRPLARDEALAELARRYITGHGPAQAADLSWWSGLTMTAAREALALAEGDLARTTVGDRTFWAAVVDESLVPRGEDRVVHLLPNYDELLVAFRDRSDAIDPALPADGRTPEALLGHVVVRDGLVVGRWRRAVDGGAAAVATGLLVELDAAERAGLEGAVAAFGAFLGRPVALSCGPLAIRRRPDGRQARTRLDRVATGPRGEHPTECGAELARGLPGMP